MADRHPIWRMLDEMQMNNRADAAKLVEIRAQLATIDLGGKISSRVQCDVCGANFPGTRALSEHAFNVHDGPVPDHYAEIEALSLEPTEEPA
jgi:hypothetical protein